MPRRSGDPRDGATATVYRRSGESRSTLSVAPASPPKPDPRSVSGAGAPKSPPAVRLTAKQAEAWLMYDLIGEIGQAVRARAALVSGCQFYVGLPPDQENVDGRKPRDSDGVPLVDEGMLILAEGFLAQVVDSSGSQRGLIRAQSENWDVCGVGVMVCWYERADGTATTETDFMRDHLRWEFVGANEYRSEGGRQYLRFKEGGAEVVLPADAVAMRMWRRTARFPADATGWVMAVLPIARNILAFQLAERSQALSSAVGTIHVVPSDAAPRKPLEEGQDPSDGRDTMTGEEWAAHLDEMIGDVIAEVIDDWQSGRTVQGGVLAVEGTMVEKFGTKIEIGRAIDVGLGDLTDRAIKRLKESADIAPEMLSGLGDTNRWNGAQIDDTEYRRYHRPHLQSMADDWTTALLWPFLVASGYNLRDARQLRVLVGTKGVVADPDLTTLAEKALKVGAIGWDGFRTMSDIPPQFAPTTEEQQAIKDFLSSARPPTTTGDGSSTPPAVVAPVNGAAGANNGPRLVASSTSLAEQLLAVETQTRAALTAAGAVAMDQVMARAGSKMANLARRHKMATVPTGITGADVLTHLGPDVVRAIGAAEYGADDRRRREEMFAAALALLQRHFTTITRDGMRQALEVLGITWPEGAALGRSEYTGGTISQAEVLAQIDAGWSVLDESLTGWADATVFGSDDPVDEENPLEVPSSVWRRSMAAVGGASVAAGWGPVRDTLSSMVFGPRFAALEPPVSNYLWVYGSPGSRRSPFDGHQALANAIISGPDDDQLAGAPWGTYWPDDHTGCQCDVIPTFEPVTE